MLLIGSCQLMTGSQPCKIGGCFTWYRAEPAQTCRLGQTRQLMRHMFSSRAWERERRECRLQLQLSWSA